MNLENLLSKERLKSYNDDKEKHLKNLKLIGKITHKIALIEIALRNSLDNILKNKDFEWIIHSKDDKIKAARDRILGENKNKSLTNHQFLSRLSLGLIIHMIIREKLQNRIMDLKDISLKKYDENNKDFVKYENKKSKLTNVQKVDIILSLLHNLRNRCYHWENILKTRIIKDVTYPRLTTRIHNIPIGLNPEKIQIFLDDVLSKFDENLLVYAES